MIEPVDSPEEVWTSDLFAVFSDGSIVCDWLLGVMTIDRAKDVGDQLKLAIAQARLYTKEGTES